MAEGFRAKLSGREEIPFEEFEVTFTAPNPPDEYPVVDYGGFENTQKFDENAAVVLRLTEGRRTESVNCGTIIKAIPIDSKAFEKFRIGSFKCSFRIVSTAKNSTQGKILGSTIHEKIILDKKTLDDDGLLSFKFDEDIDPLLWDIDIDDKKGPIIKIEKTCPNARDLFRNDLTLVVSILPSIIQQIMMEIYSDGTREHTGWKKTWGEWAINIAEEEPPRDELEEWINKVIDRLMTQEQLLKKFIESKEDENE